ncbi:alpha/beta fold hydrolase [Massilia sp. TS11]|uniref:alpha/beta fold hydrolase n=1 Tax=Massilia sp. TS11 TaxID=2908003 RepID=UPI001EDB778F|nr:alpha/beta hydrolase [Massilia sp. TS11]MCG2584623.1 alpha/beta hydrolase [Massilia sp. TS11]
MEFHVNGLPAYVYTGGKALDPAKPSLVFIHGAQNDHSVWALQSRALAHHGYNVLALDLPGHGRSAAPALSSVEAMADWLWALLDAAGIARAALIGHSMGSLIALEAAARAPARIAGLAMLGSTYPMKVADALLATARDNEPQAIEMVTAWSHASQLPRPSTAGPGVSVHGAARRLMQRMSAINPAQLFYTDFAACNQYANGAAAAAAVSCPTLFIFGSKDMMTPARSAKGLTASIAHGKIVMVEAGHALMQEQPDAVLDALRAFAASLPWS